MKVTAILVNLLKILEIWLEIGKYLNLLSFLLEINIEFPSYFIYLNPFR